MSSFFTQQEQLHYARHFNLAEIGIAGQLRLKNARVLYVGAGGLGSAALPYLAAAGIGTLGVIDNDVVEASNLQRQVLYSYAELGCKKVIAAQARLQQLNPHIEIIAHDARLTAVNVLEIINKYDVIADGSDNFATRYLVNDACFHLKKPLVYASIARFTGQCSVFATEHGPCYRCLFASPPPSATIPNCAEGGVLGVLPGILGAIQAGEVIKLILGLGQPLIGRMLSIDALAMTFREVNVARDPECKLCHYHATLSYDQHEVCMSSSNFAAEISVNELKNLRDNNADFVLLDVRENNEYQICNLAGKHIPLRELPNRLAELDKDKYIVVHCKHGGRSRQALQFLNSQGFNQVSNLTGGIMAWIEKVDNSLARY